MVYCLDVRLDGCCLNNLEKKKKIIWELKDFEWNIIFDKDCYVNEKLGLVYMVRG